MGIYLNMLYSFILVLIALIIEIIAAFLSDKKIKKIQELSHFSELQKIIKEKIGIINVSDAEKFTKDYDDLNRIIIAYSRRFINKKFSIEIEERRRLLKEENFQEYANKLYTQIIESIGLETEIRRKGIEYAGLTLEKLDETMLRSDVKIVMSKNNLTYLSHPDDSDISILGITNEQCIEMFFYISHNEREENRGTRYVYEAFQKKINHNLPLEESKVIFSSYEKNFLSDCLFNKFGVDSFQYEKATRYFRIEENDRVKDDKEKNQSEFKKIFNSKL